MEHPGHIVLSRAQLAQAVTWWGERAPGRDDISLSKQVKALVEPLALMDFFREDTVRFSDASKVGALIREWLQANPDALTSCGSVDATPPGARS